MTRIFVLDSDPANLICQREKHHEAGELRIWMFGQRANGAVIAIPEIVDYEVRRKLIHNRALDSLKRLDRLQEFDGEKQPLIRYLPITTVAMRKAAELWAEARWRGESTADPKALDGDVILAAQAMLFCEGAADWSVVTENANHISRYIPGHVQSRRAVVDEWLKSSKSWI